PALLSFPTRRSSDLHGALFPAQPQPLLRLRPDPKVEVAVGCDQPVDDVAVGHGRSSLAAWACPGPARPANAAGGWASGIGFPILDRKSTRLNSSHVS